MSDETMRDETKSGIRPKEKRDKKIRNSLYISSLIPYFLSLAFVLSLIPIFSSLLFAVPPPPGFPVPEGFVCRVNRAATASRIAAVKAAPFFQVPLSPTTAYVAVIRVEFADAGTNGNAAMSVNLAATRAFFEKVKDFYLENSYGLLTVSATITNAGSGTSGSYRLPANLSSYACGINSNWDKLAKDAAAAADAEINFADARPDLAGNQPFNAIMLYHAGPGAETSNTPNSFIWSVFVPTSTSAGTFSCPTGVTEGIRNVAGDFFRYDTISFSGMTVVPEKEVGVIDPLGVICHEFGHQLGLPDLYLNPSSSVPGNWTLMDSGVFVGSPQGSNPSHFDAWSKQFLGFSAPQIISSSKGASSSIAQAETSRTGFIRIPIDVSSVGSDKEYFLLEYRRTSGATYDNALPGQGLIIWHIDDSIASNESRLAQNNINSGVPNRGVDIVTADSSHPSDFISQTQQNRGDDGDPFPGSTNNSSFNTPKSDAYNGTQSGIVVSNISGAGSASMTMNITKLGAAATLDSIAKMINYPNPASPSALKGSRAAPNTLTTLVFQLSRPFKTAKLSIHDLSGTLVRNISQGDIQLQAQPSTDFKWVYEYNWDGKNDDGESVGPGVYLYRFKADDTVLKIGKMVVIK